MEYISLSKIESSDLEKKYKVKLSHKIIYLAIYILGIFVIPLIIGIVLKNFDIPIFVLIVVLLCLLLAINSVSMKISKHKFRDKEAYINSIRYQDHLDLRKWLRSLLLINIIILILYAIIINGLGV